MRDTRVRGEPVEEGSHRDVPPTPLCHWLSPLPWWRGWDGGGRKPEMGPVETDKQGLGLLGQRAVLKGRVKAGAWSLSLALGLVEVSFWNKTWREQRVADESQGLAARPHPALETVLTSKVVAGERMGTARQAYADRRCSRGPGTGRAGDGEERWAQGWWTQPRGLLPGHFTDCYCLGFGRVKGRENWRKNKKKKERKKKKAERKTRENKTEEKTTAMAGPLDGACDTVPPGHPCPWPQPPGRASMAELDLNRYRQTNIAYIGFGFVCLFVSHQTPSAVTAGRHSRTGGEGWQEGPSCHPKASLWGWVLWQEGGGCRGVVTQRCNPEPGGCQPVGEVAGGVWLSAGWPPQGWGVRMRRCMRGVCGGLACGPVRGETLAWGQGTPLRSVRCCGQGMRNDPSGARGWGRGGCRAPGGTPNAAGDRETRAQGRLGAGQTVG